MPKPYMFRAFSLNRLSLPLLLLFYASCASYSAYAESRSSKQVAGLYETVSILPHDLKFKAKVDSGATNSSMHATDVEFYAQSDKQYVRFNTVDSNGKTSSISLPLFREAKIKRHGGASQSRAVVILGVCLGPIYKQVQVTLTDRSRFSFPFLVGASYLRDDFVVDVAQEYMNKANCTSSSS